MKQKYYVLPQLVVAFLILAVSIYKASSVHYAFSQAPSPTPSSQKTLNITYQLPDPAITPESPFWPVQALIDKTEVTPEDFLENADVRIVAGKKMVEKGKVEEGYVVVSKAEQYLEHSYNLSFDIQDEDARYEFLNLLSEASLKHREVLEELLEIAPEDGRAVVVKIMDTPKMVYEKSSEMLLNAGLNAPSNPF